MITKEQFESMVQVGISDNAGFSEIATTANKIAKAFGMIDWETVIVKKVCKARGVELPMVRVKAEVERFEGQQKLVGLTGLLVGVDLKRTQCPYELELNYRDGEEYHCFHASEIEILKASPATV